MCWYTFNKENTKAKIAKQDKTVYKIMVVHNNVLTSACQYFDYEIGKEYQMGTLLAPQTGVPQSLHYIDEGFHSYSENCRITRTRIYFYLIVYGIDKQTIITAYPNHYNIVQCIIPKGSTYYENEKGEIVSDKIIVTDEIIDIKELKEIAKALLGNGTFNKIFKCHNDFFKKNALKNA